MKRVYGILPVFLYMVVHVQTTFAADTHGWPEDVNSLIAKTVAAYGGEKAIEGATGIRAVGDINAIMRRDRGSYEFSFKRPRKLRVDTKYQHSFEIRLLNGNSGYRGTAEASLAPVKDQRFLAMVYQYKHIDILYGIIHDLYTISRKGKEDLDGKSVEVLHLTDQEGPPMDVYIGTTSFYIVKVTGYIVVGDGRSTTLSSEFSDFRKVGDTVFPFKVTNYAGGQKIAETVMKTYTIDPAIPDSIFAP
jgi:hypothetical protein